MKDPAAEGYPLPKWLERLDLVVWVTGPDRRLVYVNSRAEQVFARSSADCVGERCHSVVRSRTTNGAPFCGERCPLARRAESGLTIGPVVLEVGETPKKARVLLVVPIPLEHGDPSELSLVHCAVSVDRWTSVEGYLARVAERTAPGRGDAGERGQLTKRELDVLEHLALDEDPFQIAAELHVSYATVRNHVKHVLRKLDVHTSQEAIARYVLGRI